MHSIKCLLNIKTNQQWVKQMQLKGLQYPCRRDPATLHAGPCRRGPCRRDCQNAFDICFSSLLFFQMPGYKQILGLTSPAGHGKTESILFGHLLHLWSIGEISAIACQKIALAAHQDGLQQAEIVKMASFGA